MKKIKCLFLVATLLVAGMSAFAQDSDSTLFENHVGFLYWVTKNCEALKDSAAYWYNKTGKSADDARRLYTNEEFLLHTLLQELNKFRGQCPPGFEDVVSDIRSLTKEVSRYGISALDEDAANYQLKMLMMDTALDILLKGVFEICDDLKERLEF